MNKFSRFVEKWWLRIFMVAFITFAAWFLVLLTSCSTSRAIENRSIKDSIVYTYKTLYRDSLRIKDSTVVSYSTVQRDSIVMKVDNVTGTVLSKESWHWKDTDKDRSHITDVRNMAEKRDSVASTASKSDKQIIKQKKAEEPSEVKKTHYWKTWWLGVLCGISISLCWKYRKTIVNFILHRIV